MITPWTWNSTTSWRVPTVVIRTARGIKCFCLERRWEDHHTNGMPWQSLALLERRNRTGRRTWRRHKAKADIQKVARSGKKRRAHRQQVGRGYRGLSVTSLRLRKDLMKQNNQSTVSLDVCNLNMPSLPFNCSSENCKLGRKWKYN